MRMSPATFPARRLRRTAAFAAVMAFAAAPGSVARAAVIGLDARHGPDPSSILATGAAYSSFRSAIAAEGHSAAARTSFNAADLTGLAALVVQHPFTVNANAAFTASEIAAIQDFVAGGGGLIAMAEAGSGSDDLTANFNALIQPFGASAAASATSNNGVTISGFVQHAVTAGLASIGVDYQRRLSFFGASDLTIASGQSEALAAFSGGGNVLILSDSSLWRNDGTGSDRPISFGDNLQLLRNALAFAAGGPATGAVMVSNTLPVRVMTGQRAPFTVTVRNTGRDAWTEASGHGLTLSAGPAGLLEPDPLPLPPGAAIPPGGEAVFAGILNAPEAAGGLLFSLRVHSPAGFLGEELDAFVEAGNEYGADFAAGTQGWTGALLAGTGSAAPGASGLCMTVPENGDNIAAWVSPERFLPLKDQTIYRLRIEAPGDQNKPDATPLWNVVYNNYSAAGGNNFGGEAWILDVEGGANAVGKPNGKTRFDFYFAPAAAATPQWRGGIDPADSAFSPEADALNDIALLFRVLDIGSANVNANFDSGTICVRSLSVAAFPIDSLAVESVEWSPPIQNATHLPEGPSQGGGGSARIDDSAGKAKYELAAAGPGSRKSLFPYDPSQPGGANLYLQLFPVRWEKESLYRGTIRAAAGADAADPPDSMFLIFDTPTNELGQTHYVTRGAPGNMRFAGSPRPAAETGGAGQEYAGYFYTQNSTASGVPNAARFRFFADFFNTEEIGPEGLGSDPFEVEAMMVEKLTPLP